MQEYIAYWKAGLEKMFVFDGRDRRKAYWSFILINFVALLVISFILGMLGTLGYYLSILVQLAFAIVAIAAGVRRMHDIGKKGYFVVLSFIPLICLVYLYFAVQDSQPGSNEYGPNPKGV